MADSFYDDIPARANNIGTDVDQIELTLGYIKDVFQQITGGWNDSTLTGFVPGNFGMFTRTQFKYKDSDEIYIEPAVYHHDGSTDQMTYWNTQLTFAFGSGGSNASSSDLGASEWHYLYIDDSAVVSAGTNLISVSELVNSTTAPTWTVASHAWMNGNDRCIGAFRTDASNNILSFYHDGGRYFEYDLKIVTDKSASLIENDWADTCTLVAPGFATRVEATFQSSMGLNDDDVYFEYRTTGSSSAGHRVMWTKRSGGSDWENTNRMSVYCDTSQSIDVRVSEAIDQSLTVWTDGYYFPIGM